GADKTSSSQSALFRCLEETALLEVADSGECAMLREKFVKGVFSLVVAGQFKRGKSSLINAMMGKNILPVGVVPLTSIVTVLRYGGVPAAAVHFQSGEIRTIPMDVIAGYVTEKENPNNVKSVKAVLIDYPSDWLREGTQIVDTPGIDSVYQHNTDVARAYLPRADAILFVASLDQPLSRGELDFLAELRRYTEKVFVLLNKSDYLNTPELQEAVAFSSRTLHEATSSGVSVFPVSARLALEAKVSGRVEDFERSGLPALEAALHGFLSREKAQVWSNSIRQSLLSILSKAHLTVRLEFRALSAPLEQTEEILRYIEQKRDEIFGQRADYDVLLANDVDRLFSGGVRPELERFKEALKRELSQKIGEWYGALRHDSPKRLERELESRIVSRIQSACDEWRTSQDSEWNAQFETLCSKYWVRIQATIDDLQRHAAERLSIPYKAVNRELLWQAESDFYYKFWDEPPSLLIITAALVHGLPRFIGGPLIVRRLRQRAGELVETQTGRIRHDFDERLQKNLEQFRSLIQSRVESALGEIEIALRKGMVMNRESRSAVDKRKAVLTELDNRITRLQSEVRAATDSVSGAKRAVAEASQ
ncbi:MAG: dynamin family protein, partial [Gammaproteobacteria bacterium]